MNNNNLTLYRHILEHNNSFDVVVKNSNDFCIMSTEPNDIAWLNFLYGLINWRFEII